MNTIQGWPDVDVAKMNAAWERQAAWAYRLRVWLLRWLPRGRREIAALRQVERAIYPLVYSLALQPERAWDLPARPALLEEALTALASLPPDVTAANTAARLQVEGCIRELRPQGSTEQRAFAVLQLLGVHTIVRRELRAWGEG